MLEIDQLRQETPGCGSVIHFNNAGAALMPLCVSDAVKEHLDLELHHGGYEAAAMRSDRLNSVYGSVAKLINANPDEIAIMDNATIAWQMAFYSLDLQAGDVILTVEAEYAANYVAYLQLQKRHAVEIKVIPSDYMGALDLIALENMITDRVKLISVTHIPTNGGLINPAADVGKIARKHNITYLLDACQSIGQMPVDVEALGCDILSATGRKFLRGPRGTGFLYMRRSLLEKTEPIMLDHFAAPWVETNRYEVRADARRFENWENAYALRAGLGVACEYAMKIGLSNIEKRNQMLATMLRDGLTEMKLKVTDIGHQTSAIVTCSAGGADPLSVKKALSDHNMNVTVSVPSSTRIDSERRLLPPLLRMSPHYYNTEEEVARFLDVLRLFV